MIKKISGDSVYYKIAWSPVYRYDKYEAMKVVTELPGIICLMHVDRKTDFLIFYSCWRDGCRGGLKKFLNSEITAFPEILKSISGKKIYYKYTVVEGNISDMKDIMHQLIAIYKPEFNNHEFKDSERYRTITLTETERGPDNVVEKLTNFQPVPR